MDMVYEELLPKNHLELISIKSEHEILEEILQNIFKPFIGKTDYEIEDQLTMK